MKIQSDHLDKTNYTYLEHASEALGISFGLFTTSLKMLVHAVVPDVFTTSASDYAAELNNKLNKTPKNTDKNYGTFSYEKIDESKEENIKDDNEEKAVNNEECVEQPAESE